MPNDRTASKGQAGCWIGRTEASGLLNAGQMADWHRAKAGHLKVGNRTKTGQLPNALWAGADCGDCKPS